MGQTPICQRNQVPCEACVRQYGFFEDGGDGLQLRASKGEAGVWFDDSILACAYASSSSSDNPSRRRLLHSRRKLFSPHLQYRFRDFYLLGHKLGDGASADVFEAVARPINRTSGLPMLPDDDSAVPPENARRFAVKIFTPVKNNPSHKPYKESAKNLRDFFQNEWEMLAQLEHPHIVRMYECFQEENCLYIVMDMCYGGELIEHVREFTRRRGKGGLEEADARVLFRQMLYAAVYLHSHNIVHRDIKLENFLLVGNADSAKARVIKLCDFGTAVELTDASPRAPGRIGTLSYTAPEICSDKGATVQADSWSLGVVAYVLFVGAKPFRAKSEESREDTMARIIAGNFNQLRPTWREASDLARDIVKSLIVTDENKRATTIRALHHKWCSIDAPSIFSMHQCDDMIVATPHLTNLVAQVTSFDPLQQFVLSLCSKLVDESSFVYTQQWAAWHNLFFALDTNKDGRLDFAELTQGMWTLCGDIPSAQLTATLQALDLNASGAIEWTEWVAVALLSIRGFPLQDELLATAARLLEPRHNDNDPTIETIETTASSGRGPHSDTGFPDLTTEVQVGSDGDNLPRVEPHSDPGFPRFPTKTKAISEEIEETAARNEFPKNGRLTVSLERIQELRERFAAWVPAANTKAIVGRDISLADLREILETTSWFGLDSSSKPFSDDRCHRPAPVPMLVPQMASGHSPLDPIAASPRDWSRECPQGPQQTRSASYQLSQNHASSLPNTPSASPTASPSVSPDNSPRNGRQRSGDL